MNTSISPPVAATPVAEVPVTLPIGDAGLSFSDRVRADGLERGPNTEPMPAEQKREGATSRAALPINDCGGVGGTTPVSHTARVARAGLKPVSQFDSGKGWFDSGPQSLSREFVAVTLAWFCVLGATALGGLL